MLFEFTPGYKKYIASPQWKMICQRYWQTYGKRCQACKSFKDLQVHHKTYERFGRELLTDLCGLCKNCHREVHQAHRANRSVSLRVATERYVIAKRMGK